MKIKNIPAPGAWCMTCLAILTFIACRTSGTFSQLDIPGPSLQAIDSICLDQLTKAHFPGLAVSVAYKKKQIWNKGYGYADLSSRYPVDPDDHLFRIGSISKTVTASALARLIQQQKLSLDTPVSTWYVDCPPDKHRITLRQLGGHLAGIRHYTGLEFYSNIRYADIMEPLDVFIHDTLLCEPGSEYHYSTYGWTIISAIMEWATGVPFLDIVHDEVCTPLQIPDLRPDHRDSTWFNRVTFYDFQNGGHIVSPEVNNSNKWAGGGFLCSAEDLAKFGFAHTGPGYLSEASLTEYTQSQTTTGGDRTSYGIGFRSGRDEQGRYWYGHSGGSIGGTSMLLIYPEEDLVVVTLVNLTGAKMDDLAFRIADLILRIDGSPGSS